jgi:hypothetical protein
LAAMPTLIVVRPGLIHQLPLVDWLRPSASEFANGIEADPAVPPPKLT